MGHGWVSSVELVQDLATMSDDELERAALAWRCVDVALSDPGDLSAVLDEDLPGVP